MSEESKKPTDMKPEDVADTTIDDAQDAELAAVEDAAAETVAGKSKADANEGDDDKPKLEFEEDPHEDLEESMAQKLAAKKEGQDTSAEDTQAAADDAAAADTQDKSSDDDASDPFITVKVDGEERKVRQSQLISHYQKGESADKRLQEATNLLKEVREVTATKSSTKAPETDGHDKSADESTSDGDNDRLATIVDKITLGERDEAIEGLKELIKEARQGQQAPEDLDQRVRASALEVREAERSQEALQGFFAENAILNENPRLAQTFTQEVGDQMRSDIRSVLESENVPEEQIRQVVDGMGREDLIRVHRTYRAHGFKVRDTKTVLTSARDALAKDGFWPQQKTTDRAARKEQTAQHQPASRSHQTPVPNDGKPAKPQTVAEIVAEENRERGVPTI